MGQVINAVKVKCDYDNGRDKNFVFNLVTDGTVEDVQNTVNTLLRQKFNEGELDSQNLRNIEIKSDDSKGFFSSIAGDVKGFLSSL